MKEKLETIKDALVEFEKMEVMLRSYGDEYHKCEMAGNAIALIATILAEMDSPWQPIETAPKNGIFLAYDDGKHWIAKIENGVSKTMHFGKWTVIYPTHWMPLPKQP